ncbi:MAG: glycosyltransferase family 9 protein [Dehalococcoidia bacterium]
MMPPGSRRRLHGEIARSSIRWPNSLEECSSKAPLFSRPSAKILCRQPSSSYLADIPLRLAHCHEIPYGLLTDWPADPEPQRLLRHEVRRHLDLVAGVGSTTDDERLSVRVSVAARERVRGRLDELQPDRSRPWAIIHPGATASSRRYPPEGFARVARELTLQFGWQVLFTDSVDELDLIAEIRRTMAAPSWSLAGELPLEDLVALISEAPILIVNNTGPAHIAAATGTPVVELYALTNPQHTPWAVPNRVLSHDVPCKNCYRSVCPEGHHNCLRLVTPQTVVAAAIDLARETRRQPVESRAE